MMQHYLQWCWQGQVQHLVMPVLPGSVAVCVFFLLSGFVIIEAADLIYARRPAAFFINRLLRIVPLYFVVICFSLVVLFCLSHFLQITDEAGHPIRNPFTVANLLANLMGIFPLPGRLSVEPEFRILRIAWALRVEMAFYCCVALLLVPQVVWRSLSFNRLFALAALVSMPLSAWYLLNDPNWNPLIGWAPFFCTGGSFYFALKGSALNRALFGIGAILSVFACARLIGKDSYAPTVLFVVLMTSCLVLAARTTHWKLDRRLGDYSYPVYVGHWLPLLAFPAVAHAFPAVYGDFGRLVTTAFGLLLPWCYLMTVEPVTFRLRTGIRGVSIRD